jgi:hypothetical protein
MVGYIGLVVHRLFVLCTEGLLRLQSCLGVDPLISPHLSSLIAGALAQRGPGCLLRTSCDALSVSRIAPVLVLALDR